MRQLSKVIWSEGMHLAPHHFQLQNKYFEDLLEFSTTALYSFPTGILAWDWNADALANGRLVPMYGRGIFPDGLPFNFPDDDVSPTELAVDASILRSNGRCLVYLTIPSYRFGKPNVGQRERYQALEAALPDDNTGQHPEKVNLGRKNLVLRLEGDIPADSCAMPVARLIPGLLGEPKLDPGFIPPLLTVTASPRLMNMLKRLLGQLQEKSKELALDHLGGGSQREIAVFWFLHCLNSGIAELQFLATTRQVHPEELYSALSSLAAGLSTFVVRGKRPDPRVSYHPDELPAYFHLEPERSFGPLEEHIRALLDVSLPVPAIRIQFEMEGNNVFQAEITDQRCFGPARWILGIRAPVPSGYVVEHASALMKICAYWAIGRLVEKAMPGLELRHLDPPPSVVLPASGTLYFEISRLGPCWDQLSATRRIGIHVMHELAQAQLELIVIPDHSSAR